MTRWKAHEVVGRVLKTVVVWGCDWGSGGFENRGLKGCTSKGQSTRIRGFYTTYGLVD